MIFTRILKIAKRRNYKKNTNYKYKSSHKSTHKNTYLNARLNEMKISPNYLMQVK